MLQARFYLALILCVLVSQSFGYHLKGRHNMYAIETIEITQNSCLNTTLNNMTLATMITLDETTISKSCDCQDNLISQINTGIAYINGLSDNDIASIIQTLNTTKLLIIKVKDYLINTNQSNFVQLQQARKQMKHHVEILIQKTQNYRLRLIDLNLGFDLTSTESKWNLTMNTIETLDSLMLWFQNLEQNKAQLQQLLIWINQYCGVPIINVAPPTPSTDDGYDNQSHPDATASIYLQGDDKIQLYYTADFSKYSLVASTQTWTKTINTTWAVKRGIGKFKLVLSNKGGAGGFNGKIIIDGIEYLSNIDNFSPSPENPFTTLNQYPSSQDGGWKNNNQGFYGAFWVWGDWKQVGDAQYDFPIPRLCKTGYSLYFQKCILDEPFKFDAFHFIPVGQSAQYLTKDTISIDGGTNDIAAAFVQRPIKDREWFGVKSNKNEYYSIGLCLKETNFISSQTSLVDDKTANVRYNPNGAGVNFQSKTYYSANITETSFSGQLAPKSGVAKYDGFWFQYFSDSHTLQVYYKSQYKPFTEYLPENLKGRRLYPCVQVQNANSVTIQSSDSHPV